MDPVPRPLHSCRRRRSGQETVGGVAGCSTPHARAGHCQCRCTTNLFPRSASRDSSRAGRRQLAVGTKSWSPVFRQAPRSRSWRGVEGALKAGKEGFEYRASPWPAMYFDNLQRFSPDEPPGRGRLISLSDVYDFEPMPAVLEPAQRKHVLGLPANIWTEHIRTEERAAHMAFSHARQRWPSWFWCPRGGIGVDSWAPLLMERYRAIMGLPSADSAFAVDGEVVSGTNGARVKLATQSVLGQIRYIARWQRAHGAIGAVCGRTVSFCAAGRRIARRAVHRRQRRFRAARLCAGEKRLRGAAASNSSCARKTSRCRWKTMP